MRKIVIVLFFSLSLGCASGVDKVDLVHVQEAQVFEDEKSVFYSYEKLLNTNHPSLLKTKVKLPYQVKVAIVRLEPKNIKNNYQSYKISQDIIKQSNNNTSQYLTELLNAKAELFNQHLLSAVIVPESLIPARADLKAIRNLAALMQAHLLLVLDSRIDRFQDKQIIKNNLAFSASSVDSYLIDTATGIIITTNSYTEEALSEKTSADFNLYQTLDRARSSTEKKIFKKLAFDIKEAIELIQK